MLHKVRKNDFINLMVCCIPLCPYKLLSIGDKDISLIYLIWGLVITFGLIDSRNLVRGIKQNRIALVAIAYFIINSVILNNSNVGSIAQFLLLWTIWIFSYRRVTYQEFEHTVTLFHKVMNVIAAYGIYEFFGRIVGLPLSDPWIDGHMIEGYNWYNAEQVGGITIFRSNGLFMEPSMFSQFLAINILLYLFEINVHNKKRTGEIILNIIALVCTLSGTGLLLLGVVFVLMNVTKGGNHYFKELMRKYKFWIVLVVIGVIGVFISPVGQYLFSRLSEFDPTNTKSISGYIRFVGQFNIASEIMKTNPILGLGIGKVQGFIDVYRFSGGATAFASLACSMIVARYAAELGVIGLIILFFAYKNILRKENMKNNYYKVLALCVLVMIPLSDSGINVSYWLLIFLINIDFIDKMPIKQGCCNGQA